MKSAIFLEKAGQSVPEAVLKAAFEKLKPVCLGIAACAVGDKDQPLIALEHVPDLAEIGKDWDALYSQIKEFQDTLHEVQSIIVFSDDAGVVTVSADDPEAVDTFDMQPYAILSDSTSGHIHLTSYLLGDFSTYAKKDSKHPPEFFAVQEEILPRIQSLMELTDNDVDKAIEAMKKPVFIKDMQKLIGGDSGLISFLSSDGTVVNITKGDAVLHETPFGWTTFGEAAAPKVEETAGSKTVKSLVNKFKGGFAPKKAVASTEPVKQPEPQVEVPQKEPGKILHVEPATAPVVTDKYVQCPKHLTTKNEIRDWYFTNAGFIPDGYKKYPKVAVRQNIDPKNLKDLDKIVAAQSKSGPSVPIIPTALRDELLKDAVVLKIVDKNSRVIPTKDQLDEIEKKFTTFSEQLGGEVELKYLSTWSFDDIKQFTAKYKDAGDVLLQSLIWAYTRNYVGKTQDEGKPAETTPAEASPGVTVAPATKKASISFAPKKKVA